MTDPEHALLTALGRLRRRARAVRGVRLAGRALLAVSVALLALFVAREFALGEWGVEILPFAGFRLLLVCTAAVILTLAAAAVAARLGGPGTEDLARHLDRRRGLKDLLAAGLTARGDREGVAAEVVRRAGTAAAALDPKELFPAKRSAARTFAVLPLLLVAFYLLGLPPGHGPIPLSGRRPVPAPEGGPGGPATTAAALTDPGGTDPRGEIAPEPGVAPAEPGAPDRILARLVPAKAVYDASDPVTLTVQAKPDGELSRPHEFSISLVLDGSEVPADAGFRLEPGAVDGAVAVIFARELPALAGRLKPGKHRVAAILTEGKERLRTPEVEIEIRGDPGGGGPKPEPDPPPTPPPAGGAPPPPEVRLRPRFVLPLFGPGETRTKDGWALVPDPEAPPGTPPRRVPFDQAAREAGRRPESGVPVESPVPADRDLVHRYFDALREGR